MSEIDRRAVILGGTGGVATLTLTGSSAADVADQAREYLGQPIGWQTIETAPKDGTRVMLYIPLPTFSSKKYCIRTGYWEDVEVSVPSGRRYRYGKLVSEEEGKQSYTIKKWVIDHFGWDEKPTHWTPFPDPPQTA